MIILQPLITERSIETATIAVQAKGPDGVVYWKSKELHGEDLEAAKQISRIGLVLADEIRQGRRAEVKP